jgi:hypothetical protein
VPVTFTTLFQLTLGARIPVVSPVELTRRITGIAPYVEPSLGSVA